MSNFNVVNLNEFTWQLNVALAGGIFAVFSLIYNEYFIYYGLVTAVYGVVTHILHLFSGWFFNERGVDNKYYWAAHVANLVPTLLWVAVLNCIY